MRRHAALTAVIALIAGLFTVLGTGTAHAFVDKDCGDFDTQAQAQSFYLNNNPSSDPHGLDADGDGVVCESLPCPCSTKQSGSGTTAATLRQKARIIKVVDGDTVDVRLSTGAKRRVRMIGIDTPEVYGTVECGGPGASRSLKKKLPKGTRVRLVSDPTQARKDRYGRLLRYVVKSSTGADMNKVQLSQGWARVYVYANDPFKRVAGYRKAQRSAKAHDRGIWGLC